MPQQLDINSFLLGEKTKQCIIDVRTPKEFAQGHIPGAINIPLFTNEERVEVGTLYKQKGRQEAILKGLEFTGPKMKDIVQQAQSLATDNKVFVHCWRGGMRSGSVAWLLDMYGLKTYTLKGGYKSFRKYVLESFQTTYPFIILGGKTGSAKTEVLHELKKHGEACIDLEQLAAHKGSAFGALGEREPPTQEQFENDLCVQLKNNSQAKKHIWLEDESRLIGKKVIPEGIWNQMRDAHVLYIDLPFEERVHKLVAEYGLHDKELLKDSILRISKRLGPQHAKNAILALDADNLAECCRICLQYYDKSYTYGVEQREKSRVHTLSFERYNIKQTATALIKEGDTYGRS